jgi:cell division protein ZipA
MIWDWLILGVSLIVAIAVYIWRRRRIARNQAQLEAESELDLESVSGIRPQANHDVPLEDLPFAPVASEPEPASSAVDESNWAGSTDAAASDQNPDGEAIPASGTPRNPPGTESEPETVFVVQLLANDGAGFAGPELARLMAELQFDYVEPGVFQYTVRGEPVFRLANLLEPGVFPDAELRDFSAPGLALILQLPGPEPGSVALEEFLLTAHELSKALGAWLADERRRPLTQSALEAMQAEASHYPPAR